MTENRKITLEEMYKGCYDMWTWIADTGKSKQDYMVANNIADRHLYNRCFACEYVVQHMADKIYGSKIACNNCPLIDLWTVQEDNVLGRYHCEMSEISPYSQYNDTANTSLKKYYANQIAQYCAEQLRCMRLNKRETA